MIIIFVIIVTVAFGKLVVYYFFLYKQDAGPTGRVDWKRLLVFACFFFVSLHIGSIHKGSVYFAKREHCVTFARQYLTLSHCTNVGDAGFVEKRVTATLFSR